MAKLKVRKEFPYNPIHSFRDGNPFTICFVYEQKKSYIVKGGLNDVNKYLDRQIKPAICHYIFYHHGSKRGYVRMKNFRYNIYISRVHEDSYPYKDLGYFDVVIYDRIDGKLNKIEVARFKRIPRKWIKQLDEYV